MDAKTLQRFLVDDVTMEDLILAKVALGALDAGYQEANVNPPEWVMDKLSLVTQEITQRNKIELQKQLKLAKLRRAQIATPDEKRQRLDEQIAALEQKLS